MKCLKGPQLRKLTVGKLLPAGRIYGYTVEGQGYMRKGHNVRYPIQGKSRGRERGEGATV